MLLLEGVIIIIIIIIEEKPPQATLKGIIFVGGSGDEERRKNQGKVGVKRKWWLLAQSPYSSQGNGRKLPRVEPGERGKTFPTRRKT